MKFQFQTGAIKRANTATNISGNGRRFNSKLVRLKEAVCSQTALRLPCFNSKLVRLKGIFGASSVDGVAVVSIPNWCD